MTQTEHLRLIRARCVELLEIAEKRTAGVWDADGIFVDCLAIDECVASAATVDEDAAFIASCAGAAEAGWRATIAAIDNGNSLVLIDHLIAAWPIELLNNK